MRVGVFRRSQSPTHRRAASRLATMPSAVVLKVGQAVLPARADRNVGANFWDFPPPASGQRNAGRWLARPESADEIYVIG